MMLTRTRTALVALAMLAAPVAAYHRTTPPIVQLTTSGENSLSGRPPGGLLMPHQSILYAWRIHACANLPQMMHIAREFCGGQICVTPDSATTLWAVSATTR